MSNVRVVVKRKGVRELLKSEEIAKVCLEQAEQIKQTVGPGFKIHEKKYPERIGYAVSAESRQAIHKAYQDNVLLKALGKSK